MAKVHRILIGYFHEAEYNVRKFAISFFVSFQIYRQAIYHVPVVDFCLLILFVRIDVRNREDNKSLLTYYSSIRCGMEFRKVEPENSYLS